MNYQKLKSRIQKQISVREVIMAIKIILTVFVFLTGINQVDESLENKIYKAIELISDESLLFKQLLNELDVENPKFDIDSVIDYAGGTFPFLFEESIVGYVISLSKFQTPRERYYELARLNKVRYHDTLNYLRVSKIKLHQPKAPLNLQLSAVNDSIFFFHFKYNRSFIPEIYFNKYKKYGYLIRNGIIYILLIGDERIIILDHIIIQ